MPARKKTTTKKTNQPSFFDYLRFGESYTSLILGIIVVIIGTVLLLSLVRARNYPGSKNNETYLSKSTTVISQTEQETIISTKTEQSKKPTVVPTSTPTSKPKQPVKAEVSKAPKPTERKSKEVAKKVVENKKKEQKTHTKTETTKIRKGGKHTVAAGDTLWSIAQRAYGSGYNWVDIARSNKLSNPDNIEKGMTLTIPQVEQKNATSEPEWTGLKISPSAAKAPRITTNTYKVSKGDTLWDIAVRAYGDGYQWKKIQTANKLPNPDLILVGSNLNLPRR